MRQRAARGWCRRAARPTTWLCWRFTARRCTSRFHLRAARRAGQARPDARAAAPLAASRGGLRRGRRRDPTATGEAAANAIEHGVAGARGAFMIDGSAEGGVVAISVTDAGSWRPERSEGRGRGLVLMRAMMDSVEVVPGAGGHRGEDAPPAGKWRPPVSEPTRAFVTGALGFIGRALSRSPARARGRGSRDGRPRRSRPRRGGW